MDITHTEAYSTFIRNKKKDLKINISCFTNNKKKVLFIHTTTTTKNLI